MLKRNPGASFAEMHDAACEGSGFNSTRNSTRKNILKPWIQILQASTYYEYLQDLRYKPEYKNCLSKKCVAVKYSISGEDYFRMKVTGHNFCWVDLFGRKTA